MRILRIGREEIDLIACNTESSVDRTSSPRNRTAGTERKVH